MPAARPRRAAQRVVRRGRPSRPRANALLILECDAHKLARQSLGMAAGIRDCAMLSVSSSSVETIATTTERDLIERLGRLASVSTFRTIVAIGHSNETGMRLTADRSLSWQAVGKWLAPLAPQQLVLVACEAGSVNPVAALFGAVPTLRAIYAPPVATSKPQMQIVNLLVPYLVNVKSPDEEMLRMAQVANFFITGNTPWYWRRREVIGRKRIRTR